ncbi:polysaccharide biosynthesis/export family protein [Colwellia sp. MEBiC06753]
MLLNNFAYSADANYLLGAGDKILINVYDEPDLQTELKIDKSGMLSFPFLADVRVIGLTPAEVESYITSGLRGDYLVRPQVSVSILEYRPFFIHGEVKRPGGYAYQDDLRLDKAIALAGGLSARASKSQWKITRLVDGKPLTLSADIATQVLPDDIIEIEQSFF